MSAAIEEDPSSIPAEFSDLTPEWLTSALQKRGLLTTDTVENVRIEQIGEGEGFMCIVGRLHLRYSGNVDHAPATMIVKLPSLIPGNRMMGELIGAYWREILLYEELTGNMAINTPEVYYSDLTPDPMRPRINMIMKVVELMPAWIVDKVMSGSKDIVNNSPHRYVIMIEDLAPALPGDQVNGASVERCKQVLSMAATLHAEFWRHPILDKTYWITDPRITFRSRHQMFLEARPAFLERFGSHLTEHEHKLLSWFDENGVKFQKRYHKEAPSTLRHGDFRLDNIFFEEGSDKVILADWQLSSRGPAAEEVAYLISGALDVAATDADEKTLLAHYHSELVAAGITDYDYQQFQKDYARGMLLMLGVHGAATSDIDVGEERGDELMKIWLDRTIVRLKKIQPEMFQ
ncbi:MAG: hypothetical protein ACI8Z1_002199 [Candidatus Azotimanducaceae bacterium]|jgi:hypothetical protein